MTAESGKLMRLVYRVLIVLFEMHLTSQEGLVGAVVMLTTVLCVDRLITAHSSQGDGDFDAHTVAFAAMLSRPLGLARSVLSSPVPDGRFSELAMGFAWCAAGATVAAIGREPRATAKGGWLPAIMSAECLLGVMLTYAPFEPTWMFSCRVVSFACLSALLHARPGTFGQNCYLGERGYLACFCPVLFVDWWMACCFAAACVAIIHKSELALLTEILRRQDHQAPSQDADSLI